MDSQHRENYRGAADKECDGYLDEAHESDAELVAEEVAEADHEAFMAYQAAKDPYREAAKGRGTDQGEVKRRAEERKGAFVLRRLQAQGTLAQRHRMPPPWLREDVPSRGATQSAEECHTVHYVHMTEPVAGDLHGFCWIFSAYMTKGGNMDRSSAGAGASMLACTKAVAGIARSPALWALRSRSWRRQTSSSSVRPEPTALASPSELGFALAA